MKLHPKQFRVNEAWIVFQLNDAPIRTKQDGSFNCFCLMDAASCFILGDALVPVDDSEPSTSELRRLLKAGWAHKKELPTRLFIPIGQFQTNLPLEAMRQGIEVVPVEENELLVFIGEARQGFREYRENRGSNRAM
jgi:hypothetical protein